MKKQKPMGSFDEEMQKAKNDLAKMLSGASKPASVVIDAEIDVSLDPTPDTESLAVSSLSGNEVDTTQIVFTRFPKKETTGGVQEIKSWAEICQLLATPREHQNKLLAPLIHFGEWPNASRETGSAPISFSAIMGDYDAGKVSIDSAVDMLQTAGIAALVYTTGSYTEGSPRWRVIAPLSAPITPDQYSLLLDHLNGALGGVLASESWDLGRCYFYGKVKGVEYRFMTVDAELLLDVHVLCGANWEPIGKPIKASATVKPKPAGTHESQNVERILALNDVNEETINDLRSALMGMSEFRAEDRSEWMHIGHALASLKGTKWEEDAHQLFHAFSQRCPLKYDAEDLDSKWEGMRPTIITYRSIFELAAKDGWENPWSSLALVDTFSTRQDRTDAGNVALLATIVDGNLRFVPERRLWLWWDGKCWDPDQYGTHAQDAALQVAEHYHLKASGIRSSAKDSSLQTKECKRLEQAAELLEKWAAHCRNKRSVDSFLNMAKGDTRFILPVGRLDCNPWLFGVANGVVDLRTGELRAAGRDDFVTRRSPVQYDPTAQAPRWTEFIEEITAEPKDGPAGSYKSRPNLASYMQRALGYSMTASTGEHKMFVAIGQGSNGKNVLLDIMQWLMGDYCQTIPPEALMATRHDADAERPSPTAATLAGARAAISSESKDGARLDVALVKRHTGGGYMTARYMRENTFRFEITHKLWLMTNHRPALDNMDEAMRGRLHLIPFDMRWNRPGHPDRNATLPDGDKDLPAKLKQQAEGILAWLVAGAVAYSCEGLEPPIEVARLTRDFFSAQDPLGRWLATCLACDAKRGSLAAELFLAFSDWQTAEGEEGGPVSQTAFSLALKSRGIPKHEGKNGNRYGLIANT